MNGTGLARDGSGVPVPATSAPTRDQRLLLQAAIRRDDVARAALREWSARVDWDDIDYGSQRLVPLLARNIPRLGIDHPDLARMRGIHRYWWSQNQHRLHALRGVLDVLRAADVPVMMLKGVPLAIGYYADVGLRPMSDFDLLVPTDRADAAHAALRDAGWELRAWRDLLWSDGTIGVDRHPGVPLVNAAGEECDLHWHMLHDCLWDGADDEFWANAETLRHRGMEFLVPSPTDLLLHVCVHGAAHNVVSTLRWVADAAALIEGAGDRIDWDRLVRTARRRLLAYVLDRAFACLDDVVAVAPPAAVRAELAATRFTRAERREYELRVRDHDYLYTWTGRWCQLARWHPTRGVLARAVRLPGFLMNAWSIERWSQLPGRLFGHVLPGYVRRQLGRRHAEGGAHASGIAS